MPPFFAQELTFQFESAVRVCTFVPLFRHLRPFQAENQPNYVFHSAHDGPEKGAAANVSCVMLYSTFGKVRRWLGKSDGDRMVDVNCCTACSSRLQRKLQQVAWMAVNKQTIRNGESHGIP